MDIPSSDNGTKPSIPTLYQVERVQEGVRLTGPTVDMIRPKEWEASLCDLATLMNMAFNLGIVVGRKEYEQASAGRR